MPRQGPQMVLSGPESLMSFRAGLGVNLGVLGGPGGRICGALAEAEQMPQVGSLRNPPDEGRRGGVEHCHT